MKNSTILYSVLIMALLAIGIYFYLTRVTPATKADEPSKWVTIPDSSNEGRNAPFIPKRGTYRNRMGLGFNGHTSGDYRNKATLPAFNCKGELEFCEITFMARVKGGLKDNEQIRVHASINPFKTAVGYIKKDAATSHEYRISLKDACGEKVTLSFDWGNAGQDRSGIESEAYVWAVQYSCADRDRTNENVYGKLYDSSGEEVSE